GSRTAGPGGECARCRRAEACVQVGVRQPRAGDGEPAGAAGRQGVMALLRPRPAGIWAAGGILVATTCGAAAQDISVTFGQGTGLTERIIQLVALLTVLSLAPSILVMVTSFTRFVVVLSLLRTALGTATAPPNSVLISLAMFLTAFVMAPVF